MSVASDVQPLKHPNKFFIGGEWVEPSSSSTIDVIDSATEQLFITRRRGAGRRHGPCGHGGQGGVRRGPVAADDARASGPRSCARSARSWAPRTTRWASCGRASPGCWPASRSTPQWAAARSSTTTRAWPTRTPSRSRPRRPSVVSSACWCASRSAWSARSSRGTRRSSLAVYKIAPALLAGCTIVLKVSPEAPGAGYVLAEVAEAVGLPPGVLNVVMADREVSELLVRDPRVDKIAFTGSTAAGRRIASICGERIARYTLELGGKSAAVILDDADLDQGRADDRRRRVLPVRSGLLVADPDRDRPQPAGRVRRHAGRRLLRRCRSATRSTDATQMGPLAMERQRDRVEGYIEKGVDEGATLVTGGGRPKHLDRGYYIEPTVFSNVDNPRRSPRRRSSGRCCRSSRPTTTSRPFVSRTTPSTG